MKSLLLGLFLTLTLPTAPAVAHSPTEEILGASLVEQAYANSDLAIAAHVNAVEMLAPATQPEEEVKPFFEVVQKMLALLTAYFPKAGPFIQGAIEILGGISALFTLLSVFLLGALKVPVVLARFSGAGELADKIQTFSDKVMPYLKYLSMFNVQKKK